jgi:hypothetical protein
MEAVVCCCSKCGAKTDWDMSLSSYPLCAACWDSEVDVVTSAERKALYREAHRVESRESDRRYRESHKAKIRAYREAHRVELNVYRCAYYQRNVEFREGRREYARKYYCKNKGRILESRREQRRCKGVVRGFPQMS